MKYLHIILISILLLSSPVIGETSEVIEAPAPKAVTVEASLTNGQETLNLKLYVHIMRNITMNVKGVRMSNDHISKETIENKVMPELNKIWDQADIAWDLIEVYYENVLKNGYKYIPEGYPKSFENLKLIVEKAKRDRNGKSDPRRLRPLFLFMQPGNRIKPSEFGQNNFHVYLYPFIGNTSQGNSMIGRDGDSFGFHTVIGSWTNKHNKGGIPERVKIVEDWKKWTKIKRGSLSRTFAHELGHVLGLQHKKCEGNCLMGPIIGKGKQGYKLTKKQIEIARKIAKKRINKNCKPLSFCGYYGSMRLFE